MNYVYLCLHCKKNEIPEPRFCCPGRDCGCMGLPIDPPFCDECYDKIMGPPSNLNRE